MDVDWARNIISKHQSSGLFLDSNLLLLMAIGNYDWRRVSTFKRTKQFTARDFELLMKISEEFSKISTTPNILTEVDNLGRQLEQREWDGFAESMKSLSIKLVEVAEPAKGTTSDPVFAKLGLTDTTTLRKLKDQLLLTDDIKLQGIANQVGLSALNFNNLRQFE